MKKLMEEFGARGFFFKQELRNDTFAIYSQWSKNDLIAYEVVKIRKNKESERFGKIILASESYPTDREWGDRGWTIKNFSEANKKFVSLTEEMAKLPSPRRVESTFSQNSIKYMDS